MIGCTNQFPDPRVRRKGFTLMEVMVAAGVMAVGLTAGVACLHLGLRSWDVARANHIVTQILQDEAERLRLLDWNALNALPSTAQLALPPQFSADELGKLDLEVSRSLSDVAGFTHFKQIDLVARWTDLKGHPHERRLVMRSAQHGVYDQ